MSESKLVVAEKPSVARSIAAVLGATQKHSGYFEGNGFLVSWCVGHLVELAQPNAYDPQYTKWRGEDLPILPEPWQFTVNEGTKTQYCILQTLMDAPKVSSIICATDAGREGELIFRLVYDLCECKKPVERLWISSMEEAAIQEGFRNLKPAADYDAIYKAALCRAQADWLVGMNATRLFSTMYGKTLNIGRVMTPTLSLIVGREAQIAAFQPTAFYHVQLDSGSFTAQSERLEDRAEAERMIAMCKGKNGKIVSLECREKTDSPPKLYDLTSLQRDANRLLGYSAQQTLDYAQSLYEKGLATYPRTDSRYLTDHMEASTWELTVAVAEAYAYPLPFACNPLQVIDNSKVSDHHAILPTIGVLETDLPSLPIGEKSIHAMLMARLMCAVANPSRTAETTVKVDCEGISFTAKGSHVLEQGWRMIDTAFRNSFGSKQDKDEPQDKTLPTLEEGMTFPVNLSLKEGKTTPPKHFTEDTLLSAMETAGQHFSANDSNFTEDDIPESAKRKGLGTPATRAGILEKLVKTGFVQRKSVKKSTVLLPTDKGISLITILPEELQSPELTAEWEYRLRQIERGELEPEVFMQDICGMVKSLVDTSQPIKDAHVLFPDERKTIGTCPRCGSQVKESTKSFRCVNHDCGFALWKDNRFFASKRKELTAAMATVLLKEGRVQVKGFYSEKTGKTYDAMVAMEDTGGAYVNFKLVFEKG